VVGICVCRPVAVGRQWADVNHDPQSWRPASFQQAVDDVQNLEIRETHFLELKRQFEGVCCIERCRAILTANLTVQAAPCGLPTRHRSCRASLWAVGERGWPEVFLSRSLGIA
jgi:hypothetical protein